VTIPADVGTLGVTKKGTKKQLCEKQPWSFHGFA